MSWLESVKSALLNDDPSAPPAAEAAKVVPGSFAVAGATVVTTPDVNPDFLAAIKKVVMSRNTAMTQLLAAADKLASIIPDSTTRFKAAAATSSDGRTVPQILSAVDIHLQDVEAEVGRFNAAVKTKITTEVNQLVAKANAAQARITSAQTEIEMMQRKIDDLSQVITSASAEFAEAQSLAQQKSADTDRLQNEFAAAANVVRQELISHRSTIQSALT